MVAPLFFVFGEVGSVEKKTDALVVWEKFVGSPSASLGWRLTSLRMTGLVEVTLPTRHWQLTSELLSTGHWPLSTGH